MSSLALPKYNDFHWPTVFALRALGGSGSNSEIDEMVVEQQGFSEELQSILHKDGPMPSRVPTPLGAFVPEGDGARGQHPARGVDAHADWPRCHRISNRALRAKYLKAMRDARAAGAEALGQSQEVESDRALLAGTASGSSSLHGPSSIRATVPAATARGRVQPHSGDWSQRRRRHRWARGLSPVARVVPSVLSSQALAKRGRFQGGARLPGRDGWSRGEGPPHHYEHVHSRRQGRVHAGRRASSGPSGRRRPL